MDETAKAGDPRPPCGVCRGTGFHVAVGHQLGTVPTFIACTACGEADRRRPDAVVEGLQPGAR